MLGKDQMGPRAWEHTGVLQRRTAVPPRPLTRVGDACQVQSGRCLRPPAPCRVWGRLRAPPHAEWEASVSPAPRVLLLPHACAKVMFIFFYFFLLCCKFALNEYIRGIILKRVIASQPKPPSSLPVGPPGPGYQTDRISHPGGPSSHWRWAAGPVGVPRAPAYQERSPGLLLAGQRALPRSSEVAPSTRLPACGPAPSGELVLACPVPQRPLVCPPPPAPDLAQDWWRPQGVHRQFAAGCAEPVGRSMGKGEAPGVHAWPSRWLLWPGQAHGDSPPRPPTPVHQPPPPGGAAHAVGSGVRAPGAGGSRRAWRHTARDRPVTSLSAGAAGCGRDSWAQS